MAELLMPSLGADMVNGTLVEWLVRPGDQVRRGDLVCVVETSKGAIEVETFQEGTVEALLVDEGTTVPVGEPMARIREGGEAEARPQPEAREEERRPQPEAREEAPRPQRREEPHREAPRPQRREQREEAARPQRRERGEAGAASPAARRRASELGVDLATVSGSGPRGAVVLVDVERAASAAPRPAAQPQLQPQSEVPRSPEEAMRQAVAAAMERSKREIPHYYLAHEVDAHAAVGWLEERNRDVPVGERILMVALVLKAVACSLVKYPELNGWWVGGRFRPADGVHLGVAISLRRGGLVAPALHDVQHKPLDQVMRELDDLVTRARTGRLRSSEVSDPTITVSSMGEQGVPVVFPVIYPPQVAIVGVGRVVERPWVVDGSVVPRPVLTLTLAADHRASDGHRGGLFLRALDRALQHPEDL